MQVSGEERQAKVFMTIRIIKLFLLSSIWFACEPELFDDPIPLVSFNDIVIDLSFPEYIDLNKDGGFKDVSNLEGGVRGIIVYRSSSSSYRAYEKNCSLTPNEACATVEIHSSGLFLIDPCCGSSFNFSDGMPSGGPAWRPLRQYRTQINGTVLTITEEIIN